MLCLDGTAVLGTCVAEELTKTGFHTINQHQTIYVTEPEYNANSQIIFRDNIQPMIRGKHVLILMASVATGKTINEYLTAERIRHAKRLLSDPSVRLYDVCYKVGYLSPSYFSKLFKKLTGMPPGEYRQKTIKGNLA